jgi:hypothetical protein
LIFSFLGVFSMHSKLETHDISAEQKRRQLLIFCVSPRATKAHSEGPRWILLPHSQTWALVVAAAAVCDLLL